MEDCEIVKLYLDRKEAAINETKVKYGRAIYKTAYNFLGNKEDAEECENDTYFEAWQSIPPCVPEFLLAYLLKINRCRAMDRADYKNAQKRRAVVCELEQCVGDKRLGKSYIDGYINKEYVLPGQGEKNSVYKKILVWQKHLPDMYGNVYGTGACKNDVIQNEKQFKRVFNGRGRRLWTKIMF